MNPAMAAMVGSSEGEMPKMPMFLPPMAAGGMPGPMSPPATVNPVSTGGMFPGMGPSPMGAGMAPPMMMSCEMIHNAKMCGQTPGCTWVLDDAMMVCLETKEVESHKAFWIGQGGQMFPQGPPGMMGGMSTGPTMMPPMMAGGSPMMGGAGMMPPMMMPCDAIRDADMCRARMPMCQWVLDETLWACMETKEVENQKDFWTMHNMAGGKIPPFMPSFPATAGTTTTAAPAAETTSASTDAGGVAPAAVLSKTRSMSNEQSSENNNTLLLAAVTVLGFAFGIIMALLGLQWSQKSEKKLETILLDNQGVVRQV